MSQATVIPYKIVHIVDSPLTKYVMDKRVAIVGSADSIIGTGDGEKIDSYDVVVRCNLERPLNPDYYQWIGTRTDVIYHNVANYEKYVKDGKYMGIDSVGQQRPYHFSSEVAAKYEFKDDGLGWCPMSGLVCIFTACVAGAKEVYCTGFDFYRSGNYNGEQMVAKGHREVKIDEGSWNNTLKDELAFKAMVKKFPITLDKVLTEIINEPKDI